jgi:hypothetical protein
MSILKCVKICPVENQSVTAMMIPVMMMPIMMMPVTMIPMMAAIMGPLVVIGVAIVKCVHVVMAAAQRS